MKIKNLSLVAYPRAGTFAAIKIQVWSFLNLLYFGIPSLLLAYVRIRGVYQRFNLDSQENTHDDKQRAKSLTSQ